MTHRAAAGALLALGLLGCGRPADPIAPGAYVVQRRPPERKDVIAAVLGHHWVALSVHSSCAGAGTERDDDTIGDYLSGFLAELGEGEGRNWLETTTESVRAESGAQVWRSSLIVRHAAGDDEWGWGVRFDVRQDDGVVDPASFQCIGAG